MFVKQTLKTNMKYEAIKCLVQEEFNSHNI